MDSLKHIPFQPTAITQPTDAHDQLLYFTSSSLTADDDYVDHARQLLLDYLAERPRALRAELTARAAARAE